MSAAQKMTGLGPAGQPVPDLVPPLTDAQCDWLAQAANEVEFRKRIARFLEKEPAPGRAAGTIKVSGPEKTVKRIRVIGYRCFSANVRLSGAGAKATNVTCSAHHDLVGGKWVRNDALTALNFTRCGITCAWRALPPPFEAPTPNSHPENSWIAIGRFYKPAS